MNSRILGAKSVAIILGFYNGEEYIKEQIESIISQTHKNLKLFIFDDNSVPFSKQFFFERLLIKPCK